MDGGECSRSKVNSMLIYRYMVSLLYHCLYTYEYNLFGNAFPPKKYFSNKSLKNKNNTPCSVLFAVYPTGTMIG